jgi:hypothetical protein
MPRAVLDAVEETLREAGGDAALGKAGGEAAFVNETPVGDLAGGRGAPSSCRAPRGS